MKNIFLFVATLLITVLVMEVYLRYTRITPPTVKYYDKNFGSLNRPNIDYFKSVEGYYVGPTNYDGRFRENYPKRKQDKKTLRVLLIGDSFVEGIDVLSRNHFATYMENIIGKKLGRKVEVLDFGRGNCTLHASSYYFENYISHNYDADIILYFTEYRDIFNFNNYPSTIYTFDSDSAQNLTAGYYWKEAPEYKLHEKLISIPVLAEYDNSAYFRLAYRAKAGIGMRGFPNITLGKFYGMRKEQDYKYTNFGDTAISALTKKLYDTVYQYNKGQVLYVVRNMPFDAGIIMDYLKEKEYKFINLDDTVDHQYNIRNTNINAYYFRATKAYGGHWNNDGHKAVGTFLSNFILKNLNNFKMPGYER